MDILYNIKRCEKKLFLSEAQYARLLPLLREHMQPDPYGCNVVSSLYYDTDDYAIIRSCLDFPEYKEKFRLRGYGPPGERNLIFAELKKKMNGTTCKCRVDLPADHVQDFLSGAYTPDGNEQTVREIRWFMNRFHHPSPKVLIQCRREPWEGTEDPNLRITLDRDIRWSTAPAGSADPNQWKALSVPGEIDMEIKSPAAIPLWLCSFLTYFSKKSPASKRREGGGMNCLSCYKYIISHTIL